MAIRKNERALLVVSNMTTYGRSDLRWLYRFLEISGTALTDLILRPRYKLCRKLVHREATSKAFVAALNELGETDTIQAIDVILTLHGYEGVLCFEDGEVFSTILAREMSRLNMKNRLRMLYSTTCYGKSHAEDFVAAGFAAACGSLATNANAATEFPTVLTMWAAGSSLKDAIAAGNNSLTRTPQDRAARAMGFADANSDKIIVGNAEITIKSSQ